MESNTLYLESLACDSTPPLIVELRGTPSFSEAFVIQVLLQRVEKESDEGMIADHLVL